MNPSTYEYRENVKELTIASILVTRPTHIRHAVISWLCILRQVLLGQAAKVGAPMQQNSCEKISILKTIRGQYTQPEQTHPAFLKC